MTHRALSAALLVSCACIACTREAVQRTNVTHADIAGRPELKAHAEDLKHTVGGGIVADIRPAKPRFVLTVRNQRSAPIRSFVIAGPLSPTPFGPTKMDLGPIGPNSAVSRSFFILGKGRITFASGDGGVGGGIGVARVTDQSAEVVFETDGGATIDCNPN